MGGLASPAIGWRRLCRLWGGKREKLRLGRDMSKTGYPISIPLSKGKLFGLMLGSMVMTAMAAILLAWPHLASPPKSYSDQKLIRYLTNELVIAVLVVGVVFFSGCAVYCFRKLWDNRPGLIIDELGLIDNSSGVAVGRIYWSDLNGLDYSAFRKTYFIRLLPANPQKYIDGQRNWLARKSMATSMRWYESPLSISSGALKISFDDLWAIVNTAYEDYKRRSSVWAGPEGGD